MYFLIGEKHKVLFGWNPKCGCTHIKRIRNFFEEDKKGLHQKYEDNYLPENIADYTIIILIRNPYKRIISGFLDKYRENGQYREKWLNKTPLTFANFVDEVVKQNYQEIDEHHFIPQLSKAFDRERLEKHQSVVIFDIENINYQYIENLFNKKIPDDLLNNRGSHANKQFEIINYPVYHQLQKDYSRYKPTTDSFYSVELKKKVYQFYQEDFEYFKKKGFNYDIYDFSWRKDI